MARPIKDGVDYFPKDTDFYSDDKVRILRSEFGVKGMYLLDYILCDLYGKKGYYMKWDKSKCYLVSDGAGCGCGPAFVEEFISGCVRCGMFDKTVFDMFSVLTSAGIQRRFIRMLNSRENFTFDKEYFLLDIDNPKDVPASISIKLTFKKVSDKENPVSDKENPVKTIDNAQSKIEESKVNKSKVNNNINASPDKKPTFTAPGMENCVSLPMQRTKLDCKPKPEEENEEDYLKKLYGLSGNDSYSASFMKRYGRRPKED